MKTDLCTNCFFTRLDNPETRTNFVTYDVCVVRAVGSLLRLCDRLEDPWVLSSLGAWKNHSHSVLHTPVVLLSCNSVETLPLNKLLLFNAKWPWS